MLPCNNIECDGYEIILKSLQKYKSPFVFDDREEPIGLIDILEYPNDKTIETGRKELEGIAEHIFCDLKYYIYGNKEKKS